MFRIGPAAFARKDGAGKEGGRSHHVPGMAFQARGAGAFLLVGPARTIPGGKRRDRAILPGRVGCGSMLLVPPGEEGAEPDRGSWCEATRRAGPLPAIDPHYRISI